MRRGAARAPVYLPREDPLAGVEGEPSLAGQAQALVDGFDVAYAGGAILIAAGAVLLLLVLRR